MTEKELARELLEHRDDPEEWSEDRVDIETRPTGSQVVSVRMPQGEFDELMQAVERSGERLSTYVRKALAIRMHGQPIGPAVEITSGATRLTIRSHVVSRRQEGTIPVPDFPPLTASNP